MVMMVCHAKEILFLDNNQTDTIIRIALTSANSRSVDDLKKHFQTNRKDPKCRHA